jgi:hypothetical protein
MLLFCGGDIQIDAQRREESISQQHQLERRRPANEATPEQKAAIGCDPRSYPHDSSTTARTRKALHFRAPKLRLTAEEYRPQCLCPCEWGLPSLSILCWRRLFCDEAVSGQKLRR